MSQTAWKKFENDTGDIIESVGGAVNLDVPQARAFCRQHGIPTDLAKGLRTAISAYLQRITFFIWSSGRDEWKDILATLYRDCPVRKRRDTGDVTPPWTRSRVSTSSRSAHDHSGETFLSAQESTSSRSTPARSARDQTRVTLLPSQQSTVSVGEASRPAIPARSAQDHRNVPRPESKTPRSTPAVARAPQPFLHPQDTRFSYRSDQRYIYCDGTCSRYYQQEGGRGVDGTYVTDCPGTENMEASVKYARQSRAHADGTWDATWLCTECWQQKFYTERGERLTMAQVRHRIGLTRPGTHETHRTRERTRSGRDDRNVTWPESQTPRSHRDVAQERSAHEGGC